MCPAPGIHLESEIRARRCLALAGMGPCPSFKDFLALPDGEERPTPSGSLLGVVCFVNRLLLILVGIFIAAPRPQRQLLLSLAVFLCQ